MAITSEPRGTRRGGSAAGPKWCTVTWQPRGARGQRVLQIVQSRGNHVARGGSKGKAKAWEGKVYAW